MAIYKNFSGDQTNAILINKNIGISGAIKKILITNTHSANTQSTRIDIYDGTNTYILYNNIDIPPKVSLVLTDNISFNEKRHSLKLYNTGT